MRRLGSCIVGFLAVGCGAPPKQPASSPTAAPQAALHAWEQVPFPPAMPAATKHGHVEVGAARIYYASYGSGDAVILLHGGLGHADVWGFQLPALASYRVIALDSRGHGRSTKTSEPLSYSTMANDVIAVMDKLGVARAAIVGWSDGAIIGIHLAMTQPTRVSRVVAFGANVTKAGYRPEFAEGKPNAAIGKYIEQMTADYTRMAVEVEKTMTAVGELYSREPAYTPEQLARITVPILIIDGDHDEAIRPEHNAEMARWIPGAKLVMLEGLSHFALWQDPQRFNEQMTSFLADR